MIDLCIDCLCFISGTYYTIKDCGGEEYRVCGGCYFYQAPQYSKEDIEGFEDERYPSWI